MDNLNVLVIGVILLIAFTVIFRVIPKLNLKKTTKYIITVLIITTVFGGILFKLGVNPISIFAEFGEKHTKEDLEKFLSKNFELQEIEKWWKYEKYEKPIMGRSSFVASFTDKYGNHCSMMADRFLKEYIVIYNNLVVEDDTEKLSARYKEFIDKTIQIYNAGMKNHTGSLALQDIKVKKVKCNTGSFKNGMVCEMLFSGTYQDISTPTDIHNMKRLILYDHATNLYMDLDQGSILD